MSRYAVRPCPECQKPFSALRFIKYCGDECRTTAKKRQNAAYERRVKRPPHLYRKKNAASDEMQLDMFCTDVYVKIP